MQQLRLDSLQHDDAAEQTGSAFWAEPSAPSALGLTPESAADAAQQQFSLQQAASSQHPGDFWQQSARQQSPHAPQQAAGEVLSPDALSTEPINSKDAANNLNMSFFLVASSELR